MQRVEITITIGADSVLYITADKTIEVGCTGSKVGSEYIQFLSVLIESLKAMMKGIEVNRHFCPVPEEKRTKIVFTSFPKFKWTKSGILKFLGMTKKKFMHADTVQDALMRSRVFTCSNEIATMIPVRKVIQDEEYDLQQL